MAMVMNSSQRWRVLALHAFMLCFVILSLLPLVMIVSISLRPGNFAGGSLIPKAISFEHWRLALGLPTLDAQGNLVAPPFPVLQWIFNSLKVCLCAAALCRPAAHAHQHAAAADVPLGAGPGGDLRDLRPPG